MRLKLGNNNWLYLVGVNEYDRQYYWAFRNSGGQALQNRHTYQYRYCIPTNRLPNLIKELNLNTNTADTVDFVGSENEVAFLDKLYKYFLGQTSSNKRVSADDLETLITTAPQTTAPQTPLKELDLGKDADNLHQHQKLGIFVLFNKGSYLLLDEVGLGKTRQAILTMYNHIIRNTISRCVIICPKSIRRNEVKELLKWVFPEEVLGTDVFLVDGKTPEDRQLQYKKIKYLKPKFITAHKELVRSEEDKINIAELVFQQGLIIDEVTFMKNPASLLCSAIINLFYPKHSILMTGTPIGNRPEDCWSIAKFTSPNLFGSYDEFKKRYIIWGGGGGTVIGYSKLMQTEFAPKFRSISIRRLKKDVLGLPPAIISPLYLEMAEEQARAYWNLSTSMYHEVEAMDGSELLTVKAFSVLAQLTRLMQISAGFVTASPHSPQVHYFDDNPKLEALDDLIQNNDNEKLVVWTVFNPIIDKLLERYKELNPAIFRGEIDDLRRFNNAKRFVEDSACKLCIGQMRIAQGLDLPSPNVIIFDQWWSPMTEQQAIGRSHGMNRNIGTVTVTKLLNENSIDDRIFFLLSKKIEWAEMILNDNKNYDNLQRGAGNIIQAIGGKRGLLGLLSQNDKEFRAVATSDVMARLSQRLETMTNESQER